MACHLVLDVTELLEAMLSNLSMEELLRAQEVCKHWRHTVVASPCLQRMLYLKPVSNLNQLENIAAKAGVTPHWSTDCDAAMAYIFFFIWPEAMKGTDHNPRPKWAHCDKVKINPLLQHRASKGLVLSKPILAFTDKMLLGLELEGTSIARMFLTQPPCVNVALVGYTLKGNIYSDVWKEPLSRVEGLTMSDVVREVKRVKDRYSTK